MFNVAAAAAAAAATPLRRCVVRQHPYARSLRNRVKLSLSLEFKLLI